MSTEAVFVIIGAVVALVGSVAGLVWWAYRRGQAAAMQRAEDKARIEAFERHLAETRKEFAEFRQRQLRPGGGSIR
jgi:hypothetical protein